MGLALQSNAALTMTGNRIAENLTDVRPLGNRLSSSMRWSRDGRGNSWGQYRGFDADHDGIGDVPHSLTDAMDALIRRNPLAQAFLYTPAHLALEACRAHVPDLPPAAAPRGRPPAHDRSRARHTMITVTDVTKRYGRRTALSSVSLTLHAGEVTLLLGPNGAGKSTLLRCLLGITDFEGEIRVSGLDPRVDGWAVRSLIGYMPQTGGLHPDLTVEDTMRLYADLRRAPRERCAVLLEEAGSERPRVSTQVGDLSGGMRQRLGFSLALLTDPHILVLDEPSASLDAASRQWLAARLCRAAADGRLVLVSTHAGQELMDAGHRRVVLADGSVISSTPGSQAATLPVRDVPVPRKGSIGTVGQEGTH